MVRGGRPAPGGPGQVFGARRRVPLASALAVANAASLLARRPSLVPRTPEDEAAVRAGAALLGAAAGAVAGALVDALGRGFPAGKGGAVAALVAGGLGLQRWAVRREPRRKAVDAAETAGIVTAAAGAVGGAAAVTAPRAARPLWAAAAVPPVRDGVAAARAISDLRRRLAEPRDRVKASLAYHYLPSVSGGDGSLAPLDTLDREGRKFVGLATPASAIKEVMGPGASDPVRVYVGLGSARTADERVRLAVAELERLGAFRRRRVLVACPTGSGFVNPVFVEAEEYMSRGDVATVAVQYGSERSHRSLKAVPVARDTYRLLLEILRDRLATLDGHRPETVFYGESLGAWIGAEMLVQGGLDLAERLGVTRGVLLGIPHGGAYKLIRLRGRDAGAGVGVGVFGTAAELDALPTDEQAGLRYVVVTHPEDPVSNYTGLQLLWRRPFWLRPGRRHARIPAEMRWMPGLTFLQVLFDVKNATSFTPFFEARAHDYRAEHPVIVRIALGHADVTEEQLAAIAERTVESAQAQWERERGRRWK